jgi:hypothetical protein
MRIQEILTESRYNSTIVVDVQPAYSGAINFAPELMSFLNTQKRILMLVNGVNGGSLAGIGYVTSDTIPAIKKYWENNGFTNWEAVTLVEKGFGYLRNWMDMGISENTIIRTIREMYSQRVSGSNELFKNSDDPELELDNFVGSDFDEYMLDDPIYVKWMSLKILKQFSGSYIAGGGKDECLKEVEILMSAFNIKSTRISKFLY